MPLIFNAYQSLVLCLTTTSDGAERRGTVLCSAPTAVSSYTSPSLFLSPVYHISFNAICKFRFQLVLFLFFPPPNNDLENNISTNDTLSTFKCFFLDFIKKYRMWADGTSEEETNEDPDAKSRGSKNDAEHADTWSH